MGEAPTSTSVDARPLASVVIPNYDGMAHLPACLASLRAQTYAQFEIILVDNGSRDESIAFTQSAYPEVRVISLAHDGVFVDAVNSGIRASRGDVVVLLNNDTEAAPTWLSELICALNAEPAAGMAASKMRLFDRRQMLHNAGDGFGRDGLPINRGVWQADAGQFDADHFVFAACGGAAAYRKAMLDQIGLFDQDFVAYCEDIDLAWRAQLAGWRCVFAPHAVVYHKLSATGGGSLASYFVGRNTLWVVVKNLPASLWRKYWRRIFAAQLRIARDALVAWRGDAARARLKGQLAGLRGLHAMLAKRRQVQARRQVSDRYLESLLS